MSESVVDTFNPEDFIPETEAIELYKKSIEAYPEKLSNYYNLGNLLIDNGNYKEALDLLRNGLKISSGDSKIQTLLNKLPRMFTNYYPNPHLVKEQQDKLNEYYWCSDISVKEIKKRFRLPENARDYVSYLIHRYKYCPNCNSDLVYKTRSKKTLCQAECEKCAHQENDNHCNCNYCKKEREQQEKKRRDFERAMQEEQKRKKEKEFNAKLETVSTIEYITWAISKLNNNEKFFTKVLYELFETKQDLSWKNICQKADVGSHEKYLKRLISLSFILHDGNNNLIINSAVKSKMIEIEEPEFVPPFFESNVDFFNEDWKENMRRKKEEALEKRLDRLEEVKEYWLSCRGYWRLTSYDEKFINSFIKKYDPDWIKKAIKIATDKGIQDCGKYVAGILKNWLEHGFPDDELNLKLAQKPATDSQINYVKSLLELNNISLNECCGKNHLNELSMLDAKNIIGELNGQT